MSTLPATPNPYLHADRLYVRMSVVDANTVQVQGLTPQQMIELLRASGTSVVVDGKATTASPAVPSANYADAGLSERELEILRLIATGLPNVEIAQRMYLSINTVKTYIRAAYRKMQVETRTQAVLWSIDHGVG